MIITNTNDLNKTYNSNKMINSNWRRNRYKQKTNESFILVSKDLLWHHLSRWYLIFERFKIRNSYYSIHPIIEKNILFLVTNFNIFNYNPLRFRWRKFWMTCRNWRAIVVGVHVFLSKYFSNGTKINFFYHQILKKAYVLLDLKFIK